MNEDKATDATMSDSSGESYASEYERSAEEVAWDQEFAEPKKNDFLSGVSEFAKLAVQVPVTIVTTPFRLIPEETTRHGRAALREGFLAVRSLLGAVGDGIERLLADPGEQAPEAGGPDGTWGTRHEARKQGGSATGGKARRIELSDSDETSPVDMEGQAQEAISAQVEEEDEEVGEGRGLRADIEY
jgi:hypothetical protein